MSKYGARGGYVTGRKRASPEMNGKSANVNNVLKNHIFNRCDRVTVMRSRSLGLERSGLCTDQQPSPCADAERACVA
jgi:hypothetical protein